MIDLLISPKKGNKTVDNNDGDETYVYIYKKR